MKAIIIFLIAATAVFAQAPGRQKRTVTDAEVQRVHKSAILIDSHNDVTSATVAGMDIGKPSPEHMTDIPRMKQGGMGAQFFAVYVAASYVEGNHAANRTLQMIDTVRHDIIAAHPNDFVFAALVTNKTPMTTNLQFFYEAVTLMSLAIWMAYCALPEAVRKPLMMPANSTIYRWNEIASALGHTGTQIAVQQPANSFFLTDVERVVEKVLTRNLKGRESEL